MPGNHDEIEKRLWDAADELRANSVLKSSEYSVPVLGLIFLRYADRKFSQVEKELAEKSTGRRKIGKTDYQARGVMYLPEKARFSTLLNLPEGADIGKAINAAMKAIEDENEELKGVLPRNYAAFENDLPSDALIATEKLTKYLLVRRPVGDKLKFLRQAGYTLDNWRQLEQDIRQQILSQEVVPIEQTRYGEYFEIRASLRGPNSVTVNVRTVWMKESSSGVTKFITLYPDRGRRP